jgi:elongation factor P--(R)-beta-lysine ligase
MLSLSELHLRAALLRFARAFFFGQGFIEVDTPVRQPVIIPERNIVPFQANGWFLQASPELCMKRLLSVGCEKIFQICPCFRAGERGDRHLEEFMMLEWYRTGADYYDLMNDCEILLRTLKENFMTQFVSQSSLLSSGIFNNKNTTNIDAVWERLTVKAAFTRFSPVSLEQGLEMNRFDELLVEYVEPHLGVGSPLILYDYPLEQASLARMKEDEVAERFELYVNGVELANGFSELTDSCEQRQRFLHEFKYMERIGRNKTDMPERFLGVLDGLDRAAGISFGLDRLLMLILGKKTLAEVVTFAPSDL